MSKYMQTTSTTPNGTSYTEYKVARSYWDPSSFGTPIKPKDDLSDLELDNDLAELPASLEIPIPHSVGKPCTIVCPLCESPIEAMLLTKESERLGSDDQHISFTYQVIHKYCDCAYVLMLPL